MRENAPLTPKEYADEECHGRHSPRWVRDQCTLWIRTKGKRGIPVCFSDRPPYLIPSTARGMFTKPLQFPPVLPHAA